MDIQHGLRHIPTCLHEFFLSPTLLNFSDLAFIGVSFHCFAHAVFILAVKSTQTTAASSELYLILLIPCWLLFFNTSSSYGLQLIEYSVCVFRCDCALLCVWAFIGLCSACTRYKHRCVYILSTFVSTSLYFSIISCVRGLRTLVGSWIQILDMWCAGGNWLQIVDFSCLSYFCNFTPPGKKNRWV